jgi:HEAT repeat protein
MKKPKSIEMESLMIDHIEGKLTGELGKYVERHIEKHPDARKEYDELKTVIDLLNQEEELEVPEKGKTEFLKMIEEQKKKKPEAVEIEMKNRFSLNRIYRVAAAVALIVMGYAGSRWVNNIGQSDIQAMKQELNEMKELVVMTMMKQDSPSERIKGVLTAQEIEEADEEILNALITTMNSDDNVNVRMAALEALTYYANSEMVKDAFIHALLNQDNPTIQIKLITILVNLDEKRAVQPFQKMIEDENISTFVKDEAQYGLFQLL